MSIVQKIVTKKRWEDGFEWKKPTPEQQEFLDKLLNVQKLSVEPATIAKHSEKFKNLLKQVSGLQARIEMESNPIIKKALMDNLKEVSEKVEHIKRVVSRKLAVSMVNNYPEIADFDLDKFDSHAKAYLEVIAHQAHSNLPLDYFGVFHKLIEEKHGEDSEFHKKSGATISKALEYGDLLMPFNEEDIDRVISYISNPKSSSISEKANKFYDTYFDNISKDDIIKNGGNPSIDWIESLKKTSRKGGVTPSQPGE